MKELKLGISPCPNDTYIFYHFLNKSSLPFKIKPIIADVEELNRLVLEKQLDISKVSFALAGKVLKDYVVLRSGSALGRGCGPILLGKTVPEDINQLYHEYIGIPGTNTTAAMLFNMFLPGHKKIKEMIFHRIPDAIINGDIFAGCCIHETRFTYKKMGLSLIKDLGKWWEEETGLPIPLGGIVAKRTLPSELLCQIENAIRDSIIFAQKHIEKAMPFIKGHAQEMEEQVLLQHINLYVNDFSLNLGKEGQAAIKELFSLGMEKGLIPYSPLDNIFPE